MVELLANLAESVASLSDCESTLVVGKRVSRLHSIDHELDVLLAYSIEIEV